VDGKCAKLTELFGPWIHTKLPICSACQLIAEQVNVPLCSACQLIEVWYIGKYEQSRVCGFFSEGSARTPSSRAQKLKEEKKKRAEQALKKFRECRTSSSKGTYQTLYDSALWRKS
jgi:hypothetical protein